MSDARATLHPAVRFTCDASGIATITLDRPERGNALLPGMQPAMRAVWEEVRDDPAIRVAILSATGEKHFCTGFDVGEAVIETVGGAAPPMTLSIKNEFLVARVGDEVVASVPDLITMVDHETSSPINSERVHYGQRVTVFGIGCPPHYRTERALAVVAPRAFGFDFDYVPIEKL